MNNTMYDHKHLREVINISDAKLSYLTLFTIECAHITKGKQTTKQTKWWQTYFCTVHISIMSLGEVLQK